jgi:hypothetical protein
MVLTSTQEVNNSYGEILFIIVKSLTHDNIIGYVDTLKE